jgi:hypothetical protein
VALRFQTITALIGRLLPVVFCGLMITAVLRHRHGNRHGHMAIFTPSAFS